MNKTEFNKLDVRKQIAYINNKLEGDILIVVCGEIGISRSTISARFKKEGFKYNRHFRQYINIEEFGKGGDSSEESVKVDDNKIIEKPKTNKEQVEETISKEGLVLCSCTKDIEKLPKKELSRVLDTIGYGSSTNIYMNFDNTDYIVEVSEVDSEVDIWLVTRKDYEDIYGEIYEEDWEWGLM